MSIPLTIRVKEQGGIKIEKLPEGVFTGQFPSPPGNQIRDVISINVAGDYEVEILSSAGNLSKPTYDGEAVADSEFSPERIVAVVAGQLETEQLWGAINFEAGGVAYSIGVFVNPPLMQIPVTVDIISETIGVDENDVPWGVHFNWNQHWFRTWGAGSYLYVFSLIPPEGRFTGVSFTDPDYTLPWEVSEDHRTLRMWNDNQSCRSTTETIGFELGIELENGSASGITIDPTIINNPINQGGSGGGDYIVDERRPEPVLAGEVFA